MKTSENISNLADDIEDVLRESDIATPNPAAVGRLKFLAQLMRPYCTYCGEKAGRIASWPIPSTAHASTTAIATARQAS